MALNEQEIERGTNEVYVKIKCEQTLAAAKGFVQEQYQQVTDIAQEAVRKADAAQDYAEGVEASVTNLATEVHTKAAHSDVEAERARAKAAEEELSESISAESAARIEGLSRKADQEWVARVSNTADENQADLRDHTGNRFIHISVDERDTWNDNRYAKKRGVGIDDGFLYVKGEINLDGGRFVIDDASWEKVFNRYEDQTLPQFVDGRVAAAVAADVAKPARMWFGVRTNYDEALGCDIVVLSELLKYSRGGVSYVEVECDGGLLIMDDITFGDAALQVGKNGFTFGSVMIAPATLPMLRISHIVPYNQGNREMQHIYQIDVIGGSFV